ncbi:MAG: spore germination protein GerW family protein [Candidatus Aminicenantaceae bacterium]
MRRKLFSALAVSLVIFLITQGLSLAQEKPKTKVKQENPVSMLTEGMTKQLTNSLHVKNVVGEPVKVGKVTIIPIIMIDIGFGGGGGGPGGGPGGHGFGMSGEAKPLGFVIITKKETKFVSVGKVPRK